MPDIQAHRKASAMELCGLLKGPNVGTGGAALLPYCCTEQWLLMWLLLFLGAVFQMQMVNVPNSTGRRNWCTLNVRSGKPLLL